MSTFSNEFEETISGLVKDSKSELKNISVEMSSEEIKQKKEELIQGLEAKQKLLLEQHQELMEKIRKMQQDAAIIYREGVGIEEQLQQLKSGPFALAKEPRKKVNFQLISKKTLVNSLEGKTTCSILFGHIHMVLATGASRWFPATPR